MTRLAAILSGTALLLTACPSESPTKRAANRAVRKRSIQPPAEPAVRRMAVRVVSLNAWLLPVFSLELDRRRSALPGAIDQRRPDLACFQEVWLAKDQLALGRALAARLPHRATAAGGVLLLSRFPIRSQRFLPFPQDKDLMLPEEVAGKGLLDVVVTSPAGPLRVVVTHLSLDFAPRRPARTRQLAFLLRNLEKRRRLPLILCGDFNLQAVIGGRLSRSLNRLRMAGFRAANPPRRDANGRFRHRRGTRMGWPRRAGERRGWDPDFIFYCRGTTAELELKRFRMALDNPKTALSDHNLLIADLVLTAR